MSGKSVLLVASNAFTGTYNSFSGEVRTANYQAFTTAGDINLGTLTSGKIKMGSATSPNTYIQNSDSLIIGQNPASFNGTNSISAPAMRFQNVNNNCRTSRTFAGRSI
jgi:hypothetical protein